VSFLLVAELDECFMAAQGRWGCGTSSGEGLSRILATERYPTELDGFASAPTWLDGGRPNWVDTTENTDRNYPSIGCSVLFLNYLRYQLHYSWSKIIAAGATTLAGTYTALTGRTDSWTRFTTVVASRYPAGTPSGVTGDNIFPIPELSREVAQLTTHWLLMADIMSRHGLFPLHPQPDDKRALAALNEVIGSLKKEMASIEAAAHELARLLR
jgi:hypothetical protein